MLLDPDYARIYTKLHCQARAYGFACVLHGSCTRDLDLLLVPWEPNACDEDVEPIVRMLADSEGLRFKDGVEDAMKATVDWTDKPHGRRAVSLYFSKFGDPRWIDISVMPSKKG
jgi:hypothetical protein